MPKVETPGRIDRATMWLFTAIERLALMRSAVAAGPQQGKPARAPEPVGLPPDALWVFVSTLGELNAIQSLLDRIIETMGAPALVLLTDHRIYFDTFRDKYPPATLVALDGSSRQGIALASGPRPRLLLIAEVPCGLHDAPCRLPMALVHHLKRRGVPVAVVNGWLYRERPASRLDALERRMLARQYLRLVDIFAVQTEGVRESLIASGAPPARVAVTGNLKFDATEVNAWSPIGKRSEHILRYLLESGRPSLVAGCVTGLAEQAVIVDTFEFVLRSRRNALLIIVPRHPERLDRLEALEGELDRRGISHVRRTRIGRTDVLASIRCIILDTLGELRDFYAASTISFVGSNHNVLEALAYGKPTIVSGRWEPRYPSYPVYRIMLSSGAIESFETAEAIACRIEQLLRDPLAYRTHQALLSRLLAEQRGSVERCLHLLSVSVRA